MKQIINDNYQSIIKRGLITKNIRHEDFFHKLMEEANEVKCEIIKPRIDEKLLGFELADVILTALNHARHYHIDIESILKEKIKINSLR